jgi:hypothetical protein
MGARRFASLSVAWLCLLTGAVLCWAASAQATEVHVYAGSFGSAGSASGQFDGPEGIAVNDTTHDVYVVDKDNRRVQELSFSAGKWTVIGEFNGSAAPTGVFSEPIEIAVDNSDNPLDLSAGDVYVVDRGSGVVDKFNAGGVYEGQLTGAGAPGGAFEPKPKGGSRVIQGVAVDPNGVVWVSTSKGPIYSFSDGSSNSYISEVETPYAGADEGLAVDSEDNLYIKAGGSEVAEVNSTGTPVRPYNAFIAAVDSVGDEVYLDNLESIEAFSLSGTPIESSEAGALASSFGSGYMEQSAGVAVDASNGTVYVTNRVHDNILAFEGIKLPTVNMGAVTEQAPKSVRLNGTVIPEGSPVTSCVFEYGTTIAYGQSVPCSPKAGELGSGAAAVSVGAQLSGLLPGTTYHYRLVAENAAHIISPTPDRELVAGPVLSGESVVDVASSSATLLGSIDPNGDDTHYYFEYGPTAAYGSFAPLPAPGVDLGSAVEAEPVSVHLQGLEVAGAYYYRLVAVQNGEVFEGPDGSFTTQGPGLAAVLPDGRAWELVSPPNKKGALIELFELGGQVQAANDGSGITYVTEGPNVGENPVGKTQYSTVLSRRGPEGWRSVDLTLPGRLPGHGESSGSIFETNPEYSLFSPDLSMAAVQPKVAGTPLLSEATEQTLYLRNNDNDSFLPLVTSANVPAGTKIDEPGAGWRQEFLAATPDLSHVIIKTPLALTTNAIDEETVQKNAEEKGGLQWNLYEWSNEGLQLVNVLPGEEGVAHGPVSKEIPGVRLAGEVSRGGFVGGSVPHAVSNDGRRIAWAWGEPYGQSLYRGLYVRDMVEEKTEKVGGPGAIYQTMNSDGSKIFFLENGDLYVFDFETEALTDLTKDYGPDESSANVQESVTDVSEDGSYVYFVAKGVLASGAVRGEDDLYMVHETENGWTTRLVGVLSQEDDPDWHANAFQSAPRLGGVFSRVSPNGRYLTFMSDRSLTGYDNLDAVSGAPDEEVYLYDGVTRKLVCASCDPMGARPVGVFDADGEGVSPPAVDRRASWTSKEDTTAEPRFDHWLAGSIPGWDELNQVSTYQPRYLSDGGRLFFDSPDALVPQATNGLEDVYEYELPAGSETPESDNCTRASATFSERSGGCVSLISSGTSSAESLFYDASENGDDVFFSTTSKLVSEDYDKGYDVYDAHVCTSTVPCVPVPVSPPPCTSGDSCKAAPSPQPTIFGPAPSATFNGIGNLSGSASPSVKTKSLTNAEKLAKALKACRKKKGKRRSVCEGSARRQYLIKHASKAAVKTTRKDGRS